MSAVHLSGNHRAGIAAKIIRVDHAGERGAISIYRAQIRVGRLIRANYVPHLMGYLAHEQRHYKIFNDLLETRGWPRCRSIYLCALGGSVLGLITALLGQRYIMVCTRSVETVVNRHLQSQLAILLGADTQAHAAVAAIIADEAQHRDEAAELAGPDGALARIVGKTIEVATEIVIWLGMRM